MLEPMKCIHLFKKTDELSFTVFRADDIHFYVRSLHQKKAVGNNSNRRGIHKYHIVFFLKLV